MKPKKIKRSLVAFVDILGFSQRVINIQSVPQLRKLYKDVDYVQQQFELQVADEFEKDYRKMAGKEVLAFSDCLVISLGLDSELTEDEGTFDTLLVEFEQMGFAQMHCIQRGIFIRGGVDIGWWYYDNHKLLSNALATSYQLEGNANVPVIALCQDMYDHLDKHSDKKHYEHDFNPLHLFRKYQDSNISFWFIDYLSICLRAQGWNIGKQKMGLSEEAIKQLEEKTFHDNLAKVFDVHKKQIKKAYKKCVRPKEKAKYEWLAQYHNDILAGYGDKFSKYAIKLVG